MTANQGSVPKSLRYTKGAGLTWAALSFGMISDKRPYDAEFHARNQQKHGSLVLKLMDQPAA